VSFFTDLYATYVRVYLAAETQYRAANAIWLIGIVLEPLIYLSVWSAVAATQGGEVGGFTAGDFAAYYLVLTFVNQLTSDWHMWEFQYRVQLGHFAFLLIRPVHPIHGDIAENLAHKIAMQVVLVPALGLLALAFRPHFATNLESLVLFVPTLVLAFALRFSFEWMVALACFWTTRVMAVNRAYFMVLLFLSGQVAPLEILPGWLASAAYALPFRFMIAFPVEVALGRLPVPEILGGLALQAVWTAGCIVLLYALWPVALRRFASVGG
jgi:ABC-2 type transport system permease protein